VITRALGVREVVDIDCRIIKVRPGDQFILCSDGLCGFADDDEIFDVARQYKGNLSKTVDALIQLANDRGGSDNVTVAAFEIVSAQESPCLNWTRLLLSTNTMKCWRRKIVG